MDIIPYERIEKLIFLIRGQKVMLDRDLANLYGVKSIHLRQQVKRNINRFPSDFMFQLTKEEAVHMVSQNVIPSLQILGGHLPFAFSEHGILMLSSILTSKKAIQVNIQIMRTFTKLRQLLASNKNILKKIEEMESKYDQQFRVVFDAIKELMRPPEKSAKKIGFLKGGDDNDNFEKNIK